MMSSPASARGQSFDGMLNNTTSSPPKTALFPSTMVTTNLPSENSLLLTPRVLPPNFPRSKTKCNPNLVSVVSQIEKHQYGEPVDGSPLLNSSQIGMQHEVVSKSALPTNKETPQVAPSLLLRDSLLLPELSHPKLQSNESSSRINNIKVPGPYPFSSSSTSAFSSFRRQVLPTEHYHHHHHHQQEQKVSTPDCNWGAPPPPRRRSSHDGREAPAMSPGPYASPSPPKRMKISWHRQEDPCTPELEHSVPTSKMRVCLDSSSSFVSSLL